MTSLLATRRRAEDFARLVEGSRRSHDPNVAPLLDLVAMLRPAALEPSDAFRTSLRERLLAAAADRPPVAVAPAAERLVGGHARSRSTTRMRVVAVALSVALASGMAGTAAAARGALPGDLLYTVKRGLEHTQAAVTTNAESQGRQYLAQASTRLAEMSTLLGGQAVGPTDTRRIALSQSTLDDFAADVRKGGNLLFEAYQAEGRTAPITMLREYVADTEPRLRALDPMLPRQVDDPYAEALATLQRLDQRAVEICPRCGPAPDDSGDGDTTTTQPGPEPEPGTVEPTAGDPGPEATTTPKRPFPDRTNPGPTAPRSPEQTVGPRIPLPLPLPWPKGPEPEPTATSRLPKPDPTVEPSPLPIPLPLPTSLPLPLPSGLPLPASLPLSPQADRPTLLSLPWLLPAGLPVSPADDASLPLPGDGASSTTTPDAPTGPRDGSPKPGRTGTSTPSPHKTVLPEPLPTILPDEDGKKGSSGGTIFDDLFGPLF